MWIFALSDILSMASTMEAVEMTATFLRDSACCCVPVIHDSRLATRDSSSLRSVWRRPLEWIESCTVCALSAG